MSFYNRIVIIISKLVNTATRLLGKGSGTAITGLVAEKLSSSILSELVAKLPNTILITGTNGKTTTQNLLSSIIKKSGKTLIANKSGANLKRGILSTLIKEADIFGNINFDYAIFELEEATIPKVAEVLNPKIIIVTNLFRDQLDAYGEVDRTQKFIREAITKTPNATLILNGDDPRVSTLNHDLPNKTLFYSLGAHKENFLYETQVETNINKENNFTVDHIRVNPDLTTSLEFLKNEYLLKPPGKFHAYNAQAAILAANELGVTKDFITAGINSAQPAFGRGELVIKDGVNYKILLVKNPAGMSLTLDLLTNTNSPQLLLMLNDRIADGRDVSWIWDAQMGLLKKIKPSLIICSGMRAEDMLLRIKYAYDSFEQVSHNTFMADNDLKVIIEKDLNKIHQANKLLQNKSFFVLPTYTAMLEFRKYILGTALNE